MEGVQESFLRQIAGPAVAPGDGSQHVIVAGTIAAGKTTLTEALAASLKLPASFERPEANPFLERFYADRRRWALASQLWFAADSAHQHLAIHNRGGGVQDHSVYENVHVFGATLAHHGSLADDEWALLRGASAPIVDSLPPPAIVVLVEAQVRDLLARIRARGRAYESTIDSEYLAELNRRRREYFEHWERSPVLLVDSSSIDLRQSAGTDIIAAKVLDYLPSLA